MEKFSDNFGFELKEGFYNYGGANLDLVYFSGEYKNGLALFEKFGDDKKVELDTGQTKRLGRISYGLVDSLLNSKEHRNWLEKKLKSVQD